MSRTRRTLSCLPLGILIALASTPPERAQGQETYVAIDMITNDLSPQALGQEKPQLIGQSPLIVVRDATGGWFVRAMTLDPSTGARLGRSVDIVHPPDPGYPPNPCKILYSEHFMPGQVIVLGDDMSMEAFPISILPDGTPDAGPAVYFPPNPVGPMGTSCALTELPGSAFRDGMPRLYVGTESGMIVRFVSPVAGEMVPDEVIDLLAGKPIADLKMIPHLEGPLLGAATGVDLYGLIDIDPGAARALPAIQFVAFNPEGVPIRCFEATPSPGPAGGPVFIVFGDGRQSRILRATIPPDASGTLAMTMAPPNPIWPLLSGPAKDLALGSLLVLQDDGQKVWYDPGYAVPTGLSGCLADIDDPSPATCVECDFIISDTGDVNLSGSITSADIIFLVGFIFKSQAPPLPCQGAGDVNCSYSVNSSDVIYLVNYVFKGGSPPCDQCSVSWVCW